MQKLIIKLGGCGGLLLCLKRNGGIEMTDICFIYLPHPYLKRPDAQLPMGILMLAAMIKKDGRYSVEVKNYSSWGSNYALGNLPEAKIYGITATSMEIPGAKAFARHIKLKYPESKVMIGGPGAGTLDRFESLLPVFDMVVVGEADYEMFNIISDLYSCDAEWLSPIGTYQCVAPKNLDDLPYPARDMLGGSIGGDVFAYNKRYKGEQSTAILSSRGCPFSCAFCAAPGLAETVRYRSVDSVVDEMKHVIEEYGIKQFRFSDDLFTFPHRRALEMCEGIGPLDIAWRVSARTKPLDKDTLQAMKDAGCKELSFGVESFDDNVLSLLHKYATAKDNIRALEMCDEVGIGARILLMIGTPGQTPTTIELNKKHVDEVPHTIVSCTSFVPIPGSDVWYDPEKYGVEILSRDMRDYNFYFFGPDGVNDLKPVIKLKDRPLDEFVQESRDFRQWLFEREDVNRG